MDEQALPPFIDSRELDLFLDEQMEDYVFLAPTPPFKPNQYITAIGDVKLGYGMRYYLVKALDRVLKQYPDGMIPTYDIEIAPEPHMDAAIVRRRGRNEEQWLNPPRIPTCVPGESVKVAPTFPDSMVMYQQEISQMGTEKFESFAMEARGRTGVIQEASSTPMGTGSTKVWVKFVLPVMGMASFGFEREDLQPLAEYSLYAYKIRDISRAVLRQYGT